MKYAVIESGGKQYVAREGETVEVDRLSIEVGKSITFKEILLVVDNGKTKVGNPYVKGVTIKGTVVAEVKAKSKLEELMERRASRFEDGAE